MMWAVKTLLNYSVARNVNSASFLGELTGRGKVAAFCLFHKRRMSHEGVVVPGSFHRKFARCRLQ